MSKKSGNKIASKERSFAQRRKSENFSSREDYWIVKSFLVVKCCDCFELKLVLNLGMKYVWYRITINKIIR